MPLFNSPPPNPPVSNYEDPRDHKAEAVKDFLRHIAFIESSDGQNLGHPEMKVGRHAGTAAVGEYGLMPATAQLIAKQSGMPDLQGIDKQEAQMALLQNPPLARRLAETMASNLLAKNPSDVAAYKWYNGQYAKPNEDELADSDYVKKFKFLAGMNKDEE